MAELTKKKRTRQGHRLYVKKKLDEASNCLENSVEEPTAVRLLHVRHALEAQLLVLGTLDEEILELIGNGESDNIDDEIGSEIETAEELKSQIKTTLTRIKSVLEPSEPVHVAPVQIAQSQAQNQAKHVKLPRLEVKKFTGKAEEWQSFWDSFESAIHKNTSLSDVDKFAYLRGLVQEQASSTIAGFTLTSANYNSAVELLKRRYGKKTTIQRAHLDELLKISPVYSDRDTPRLRKFYDTIETHFRGLNAQGVTANTYSAIVVPSLIDKLPEQVRLTITRGKNHTEWSLEEMLKALIVELELREELKLTKDSNTKQDRIKDNEKGTFGGPSTASALLAKTLKNNCAYCIGPHAHNNCDKVKSIAERKKLIRKYGRCFICLEKHHLAKNCMANYICNICNGKHHVSICEGQGGHVASSSQPTSSTNSLTISPAFHVGSDCRVALQTAQAVVKGRKNLKVRVLFDSGSHCSFVRSGVVSQVGLQSVRKEWIAISTFGQGTSDSGLKEVFSIDVLPVRGGKGVAIEAYAVPSIADVRNNHLEIRKTEYPHLQGLWFSDVCQNKASLEIDLLIGADYLWCFQEGRTIRGERDEPVAVETSLGWVLSGPMKVASRQVDRGEDKVNVNFISQELDPSLELESGLRKLWDFETLGIRQEDGVHEALKDAISFNGHRYQVCLPWKEGHGALPSNYNNSLRRLKGQINKLKKDPVILEEYDRIIREQLNSGIIEPVIELDKSEKVHYLPHHAVVRQDAKTTKVRVVYDASSKEEKKRSSLNECLHVGPPLSPLLYDVLLRLREKRVALVGDIEKAFLNIEVWEKDRDCLRFLWINDIQNEIVDPVVYRFCRVVFGVNCSPFLLNATLQYHIESFVEEDPEFVRKLKNMFYVDDLVGGDKSENEVLRLYEKSKSRLAKGGFRLRKWLTNSSEVRRKIKEAEEDDKMGGSNSDDQTYAKIELEGSVVSSSEKVLGMEWNCLSDTFYFSFKSLVERAKSLIVTKRNVLSVLAGFYDPLGLISPVVVSMKMFLQELCIEKVGWDDVVSERQEKKWKEWLIDLEEVEGIEVPRCLYGLSEGELKCSLHGFADASCKAYCAVIYFVCEWNGSFNVELLTSKTRVAPIKSHTIPRLELMSGRVLAQLIDTVRGALKGEVEIEGTHLWLDSKTALCWINNKGEWKQFVRHRVSEILRLTNKEDWGHCPGEQNPADLGSRGVSATKLKDDRLWWKGPKWLCGPKEGWPETKIVETKESKEEIKKVVAMVTKLDTVAGIESIIDLERFSKLSKSLRVTAWVKRFVHNVRARIQGEEGKSGEIESCEIAEAEIALIKGAQGQIKNQGNYTQLKRELGLAEVNGILKCKGRLGNSDLEMEARQPIILPKGHKFTQLVIRSCHERVYHNGLRATLAELRAKYWVPRGRQVVKGIISKCVTCKKLQGKSYGIPPVSELPEFRVREVPPFSKVGVDFAGPLYVKGEEKNLAYLDYWQTQH